MEWVVVKTLLSLTAVLALMLGVVFLMKKFVVSGRASSSAVVDMRVLGTLVLQPKRSVIVLKVMNKVLIVGVSEDGMHTLGEVCDEQSLNAIAEKLAAQAPDNKWVLKRQEGSPSFARALALQLGKLAAKGSS
jgi:flagellar biogenesis protein FliO